MTRLIQGLAGKQPTTKEPAPLMDMSEFDAQNQPVFPQSKLDAILDELDGTERGDALTAALADRTYHGSAIARVLQGWGYDISIDAVQKWRRRNG